jgi:hypothetical protein
MLQLLGDAIMYILSIIMHRTQHITRLRAICTVLFDKELFGAFATQKVEKELSTRFARKYVFLPWKVLRSIDLAINGGINYTGLEALRKVEDLDKYQRGFLPS